MQSEKTFDMTDAPPQLGEIPQRSEMSVPTLQSNLDNNTSSTNGNASIQNAKDSIYNSKVSIVLLQSPWKRLLISANLVFGELA